MSLWKGGCFRQQRPNFAYKLVKKASVLKESQMNIRRLCSLLFATLLLMVMVGVSAMAQDEAPEPHVFTVPENPPEYSEEALADNDYLASFVRRSTEEYDTSEFAKDGPYRIALAAQGPTNSWATLFDEHARWYVDQLGTDVVSELLYADANGSADIQVPQVEDLLAQDPDVLILVPMGRAALSAPVERAMAQGVPVVLCASGVETDNFVTEVGTNLYAVGERQAQWLVDQLGGEGNIVQMNGIPGVDTAEIEALGAQSIWAQNPGINVLDVQYGQWSTAEAKSIMDNWLAQYGEDIQGIWSGGAQMSQGIISAYQDAGLTVPPLSGGDYGQGFLRLAAENDIQFFAATYPNAMVILCIDAALQILRGEPIPRFINFIDYLDQTQDFTNADIDAYFNPNWSDDVFGPIFLPDERMVELGYMTE
jgi:ABC-type sugar transport system substrate-binding protein